MPVIFKVRTVLSGHIGAFDYFILYYSKIFTKEVFNLRKKQRLQSEKSGHCNWLKALFPVEVWMSSINTKRRFGFSLARMNFLGI